MLDKIIISDKDGNLYSFDNHNIKNQIIGIYYEDKEYIFEVRRFIEDDHGYTYDFEEEFLTLNTDVDVNEELDEYECRYVKVFDNYFSESEE